MKNPRVSGGKTYLSPWQWHIETRGVITPSDFLSEEERSGLSGPVVTYMLPRDGEAREEPAIVDKEEIKSTPILTREAMESLLREGKSTSQMAKLFSVSRGTINNKKRQWGLTRSLHHSEEAPAVPKRCGSVQMEVSDQLDATAAEQLLRNIAAFLQADGGNYEIDLRITKLK
jgi:transposase